MKNRVKCISHKLQENLESDKDNEHYKSDVKLPFVVGFLMRVLSQKLLVGLHLLVLSAHLY